MKRTGNYDLATRGGWLLIACAAFAGSIAVPGAAGQHGAGAAGDFDHLSRQAEQAQRNGDGRQAISLYLRALRIRPQWADGWRSTGMLLADLKDYTRAVDAFVAHYALGWALFKAGEVEQAIPELELAAKLAPDSPQAHYTLSEAYMRANRRQDAYRQRAEFARLKSQQAEESQSAAARAAGVKGGGSQH